MSKQLLPSCRVFGLFLFLASSCCVSVFATPLPRQKEVGLDAQLKEAVTHENSQKVIALLRQGANPNTQDGLWFDWVISSNNLTVVREFLAHGAKATPHAVVSALRGDGDGVTMTSLLLNRGVNPNARVWYRPQDDEEENSRYAVLYTLLMVAAAEGKTSAGKLLVERGAQINTRFPNGLTALRVAASARHLDLCRFLLDRGAQFMGAQAPLLELVVDSNDVALFDRLKKVGALPTPVRWPRYYGHLSLPMAQRLVAEGANPNGDAHSLVGSPLSAACLQEDLPLARFLLDKGGRVDAATLIQAVPRRMLSRAQIKQQEQEMEEARRSDPFAGDDITAKVKPHYDTAEDDRMLQLLLEHGANPDITDDRDAKETALHIAALNNRVGAIRLLLQHGANLDTRDMFGRTPLMEALRSRSDVAIPELLQAGANVAARNDEDYTPLLYLLSTSQIRVIYAPISMTASPSNTVLPFIEQLVAYGANVLDQNKVGITALHLAAYDGDTDVAAYLLEHGVAVDIPNKYGVTPLAVACSNGQFAASKFLFEHGANPNLADKAGKTPRQIAGEKFTMQSSVKSKNKLSPREQKEMVELSESLSIPIRQGRQQIAALFARSKTSP